MKSILLVIFVLFGLGIMFSQEKTPVAGELPDPPYNYTVKELDSIYPKVAQYFFSGDYAYVLEKIPALIANAKSVGSERMVTLYSNQLGLSFIEMSDLNSSYLIFSEELEKSQKRKDTFGIIQAYINLGNTYFESDTDKAVKYLDKAQEFANTVNLSKSGIAIIHNDLAELYVKRKEPEQAQIHLNNVKSLMKSSNVEDDHNDYESTAQYLQGSIYLMQGLYQKSIESILKSIEAGKARMDETYLLDNYKNLIEAYDKTGQYEKLNEVRKPYDSLRDQRYEQEKIRQQQIAKTLFDVEKYQEEAQESQFQNELTNQKVEQDRKLLWIITLVGIILFLLLVNLLYTRNKRNKLLKDLQIKNRQYLEAKEKSENLSKKNTKFLSTISHELRTPLYGIIGLSSVFLNNKELKQYDEEFNSLKFSADYLLSLVNDILNINKYESKKGQELKEEHFNLSTLTNSILQTFQFMNEKNNNQVNLTIDQAIPEVLYGDKTKISQVLMNLMSNASKFTQDGSINMSIDQLSNNDKDVELSFVVADTGRGIEKENQKEIFEEFTQVPATISEGGTGLGLPIVNKLLKILKSKLKMESTFGIGTTFSFSIPLKIGSKQKLETTINGNDIKKLDHKKLLIVDDNKINQLVTQKVLEQYHMIHDTANNGQEAIDMAREKKYDYILMDINMPVMNGIDATTKIREMKIKTPVIALTAADDLNLERDIYSHGIDAILVKPYHTEQLLNLLIQYL